MAAGAALPVPLEAARPRTDRGGSSYDRAVAMQRPALAGAAVVSVFLGVSVLAGSLFAEQVYDRVIPHRRLETLAILLVILVGVLAVTAILEKLRGSILERVGLQLDLAARPALFTARLRHAVQPRPNAREGLADLDTVRAFVGGSGVATMLDTLPLPVYLAACFGMHPWLGFTALTGAALLVALTFGQIRLRTYETSRRASAASGSALLIDTMLNIESVHALGMRRVFRNRWLGLHRGGLWAQTRIEDRMGFLSGASGLVSSVLSGLCMAVAAVLAIHDEISPGNMIGAMILSGKLLAPLAGLTGVWPQFLAARKANGRLKSLFRSIEAVDHRAVTAKPAGAIALSEVDVAPAGSSKPVLKGVSFAVPPGAAVAVVGPSGAGKSTLVRALVGIWAPSRGSVTLDGTDLQTLDPEALGPHIGYLPQNVELLDGTIAENIARFGPIDDASVLAAASLAGVHEVIQTLQLGYNTEVGQGGNALSGGQRQRIGLARAIYGDPSLVVMDEPNSNLDASGEAALAASLEALRARRATCFVITHKANILNLVDFILVIKDGAVFRFGTRDEVMPQLTSPKAVALPTDTETAPAA